MIRKAPYKKCTTVTDGLSVESSGSNSTIPSKDQQRCLAMVHQLYDFKNLISYSLLLNLSR